MDFVVGEVLSAGAGRLKLLADGVPLAEKDLWVNEVLTEGYSPKLIGQLPGSCPDGRTMTPVMVNQLTRGESDLKAGDRVALLTADHQTYHLICKVVRYG